MNRDDRAGQLGVPPKAACIGTQAHRTGGGDGGWARLRTGIHLVFLGFQIRHRVPATATRRRVEKKCSQLAVIPNMI